MADPQHIASMLVGEMPPPEGAPEDTSGMESDDGETAAAQEVMDAMSTNDPQAFATALKSFFDICQSKAY